MNFFSKLKNRNKTAKEENAVPSEELDVAMESEESRSGIFESSLDEFCEADVDLSEKAAKVSRISVFEIVRRIVLAVFLLVFIVSCALLVQNLISKQKGSDIYDKLEDAFFSGGFDVDSVNGLDSNGSAVRVLLKDTDHRPATSMSDISKEDASSVEVSRGYNEELEKMRAGLRSLAQINPDVYGWIAAPGTDINYPIVQGEDNDFYLNHAYTGDFLPMGAIFADYRCDGEIKNNRNTVLYGHNIENMSGRSMFHDVTKFFRDEYFNNTQIYLYTLDGIYVFDVFAVYETRYDYQYFKTSFETAEEFLKFANEVHSNSSKHKEMEFSEDDSLLTLSTCTNGPFYARYALHAKLVKIIEG
ncbi:MAG: class B sortase [Clostridia bacterium]|nr:class B sortase [Clostridia bacterium]